MKAKLLGLLAAPLFLIAPGAAVAEPGTAPPPIYTQEEKCAATRAFADQERGRNPEATPEQVADAYIAILDSRGAYRGIEQYRERDHQMFVDSMRACGL